MYRTILAGFRDSNPSYSDRSQVSYQWATHIPHELHTSLQATHIPHELHTCNITKSLGQAISFLKMVWIFAALNQLWLMEMVSSRLWTWWYQPVVVNFIKFWYSEEEEKTGTLYTLSVYTNTTVAKKKINWPKELAAHTSHFPNWKLPGIDYCSMLSYFVFK